MAIIPLTAFMGRVEDRAIVATEKIINEAFSSVIGLTPIDTGRAKSNWEFSPTESPSGSKPLGVLAKRTIFNWTSNKSVEEIKIPFLAKAAIKFGEDINILNGLHYIRKLEYGGSTQSMAMVRKTVRKLSTQG